MVASAPRLQPVPYPLALPTNAGLPRLSGGLAACPADHKGPRSLLAKEVLANRLADPCGRSESQGSPSTPVRAWPH